MNEASQSFKIIHIAHIFEMKARRYLYAMRQTLLRITILLLLPLTGIGAGRYTYNYTENCAKAYNHFLALRLAEGRKVIGQELKNDPNNLMAAYIADYEDCILLLVNCNLKDYEQRTAKMSARLNLLSKGDESSPWYRFCNSRMYLHRAIINIRFGEQYKAALNFRKSFALLKENQRLFPNFEYNNVIAGLQEAVVGSLPGSYKSLASVFGMKGSVRKGTEKLGAFVNTHNSNQPLYMETMLYYLYARFYLLAEQQEVWAMLSSNKSGTEHNLMLAFVKVNILLDHRHADEAIETLRTAATEDDYFSYPIFDYQYGMALLTRNDTGCVQYFERYLKNNKSDIFIKDAWQRMAFVWHVWGNKAKAEYCSKQILQQGTARLDADKQAQRFAETGVWPNRTLLQARLLIEGGYYEKAQALLQRINKNELQHPADRAEYSFRLGRVYEELSKKPGGGSHYKQALGLYKDAMNEGSGRTEQFAARAALHMGKIYELLEMNNEATTMYRECLDMPAHDFQNSIDQQAKSGLNRIEWKMAGRAE